MFARAFVGSSLLVVLCACPDPGGPGGPGGDGVIAVDVDITEAATWTKDKVYQLKTHVFVDAVLTIEAGTRIEGDLGTSLVVTRQGRLEAAGTAAAPIVFTSVQPTGERKAGDWGGVVLLGSAPVNKVDAKVEGFPARELKSGFGGTDAAHNCGTLKYLRIEFAGYQLAVDNELNGLTVAGCGTGTVIDFVQVHRGSDDGVEVFGGTVDLKHVVVSYADDDSLDWDLGWTGRVQYLIGAQTTTEGNHGIEADSSADANATPRSSPVIWNMTLLGSDAAPGGAADKQRGLALRSGTDAELRNTIIARFADHPADVQSAGTAARVTGGTLRIEDTIFFDNAQLTGSFPAESDNDGGFDEGAAFLASPTRNRSVDPLLAAASGDGAPAVEPGAGSPALTGAATPPSNGFFDTSATFAGAIGSNDWTAGWTAYPAN